MSSSLNAAFKAASQLPEDQQEIFAAFLIAELKDEEEWQTSFMKSRDSLVDLAKEARSEYRAGKTKPLEDLLS